MEGLIVLIIAMALLVAFDLLALGFGADSRPTIGDDHARPVQGWPRW
jgi:hypothetical protein